MRLEVLTIRDVAEVLQLGEKTVYAMAAAGELPAFKLRGKWRLRRVDLENWLAAKAGSDVSFDAPPSSATAGGEEEHMATEEHTSPKTSAY